ncbi:hypothetical protein EDB80DRAFT_718926 [Ilyonectria destructans]|nr:hypothetical protein EDB80DRAFT_718926 [Ilyonectria destructans]
MTMGSIWDLTIPNDSRLLDWMLSATKAVCVSVVVVVLAMICSSERLVLSQPQLFPLPPIPLGSTIHRQFPLLTKLSSLFPVVACLGFFPGRLFVLRAGVL